jgi:hypothetical protein
MPRAKGTVSIRDVAAAAGVSVATVSRVLSPATADVPMRKETRDKVERAIDELGYRPNDLARALLHQRSSAIGLVVPDISNPYYPPLVRGVEDVASSHGYRVVLCNTDRDPAKISGYLDTLIKSRVDGIVVAGGGWADLPDRTAVLGTYRTGLVAVVSEKLAREYWPGRSPLGGRIRRDGRNERFAQVVGVVPDVRHESLERSSVWGTLYLVHAQTPGPPGGTKRPPGPIVLGNWTVQSAPSGRRRLRSQ